MKPKFCVLMLALCAATAFAATEVYRWVDKDGKVVYGSRPPSGVTAEKMPPPHGPATNDAAAAPSTAPADAPATGAEGRDAVEQEVKALLAQRCTAAKAIAARYEKAPYLQMKTADGGLERMAPEAEARERIRIKDEVAATCGGT